MRLSGGRAGGERQINPRKQLRCMIPVQGKLEMGSTDRVVWEDHLEEERGREDSEESCARGWRQFPGEHVRGIVCGP